MPADFILIPLVNICGLSGLTQSRDASPLFWKKVGTDHPSLKPWRRMKESEAAAGGSEAHLPAERPGRESGPEQMSAAAQEVSTAPGRPCSAATQSTSACGTFG